MTNTPSQTKAEITQILDYFDEELCNPPRMTKAEAIDEILSLIHQAKAEQDVRVLDSIGEPLLTDFKSLPTPGEYEWSIKVVKWYKDRIQTLKAKGGSE